MDTACLFNKQQRSGTVRCSSCYCCCILPEGCAVLGARQAISSAASCGSKCSGCGSVVIMQCLMHCYSMCGLAAARLITAHINNTATPLMSACQPQQ
jgi:hypothetical protein